MGMENKKRHRGIELKLSPVQIIPVSFFAAIAVGALLLWLPFSAAVGEHTDLVTALFTATTSVCVTGLVVVDTYSHWSIFGQAVILILIQIGGLGMITIASSIMLLMRRKFSLTDRILLRDAFNLNSNTKLLSFLARVVKGTFIVEAAGAILYSAAFIPEFGLKRGIWISVFNAVSAFCNAGMDVIGPDSLGNYTNNPIVMTVTILLIVFGGIGFVVWFDVLEGIKEGRRRDYRLSTVIKRFSEHSKLVISFSLILMFGGAFLFLLLEFNNPGTIGNMNFGCKLVNSLFESVTLRTAGFATFSQKELNGASSVVAYILMFIGGSPIGTAGGVKTTTFFLLIMNARSYLRNQDDKVVFNKRVSEESMRKASAVIFVGFGAVLLLTVLLEVVNPVSLDDALFEIVSACGTVGLSRGLTSSLGTMGRLTVILAMYLGRIGPISLVALFSKNSSESNNIQYSEGSFYVG